MKFTFAPHVWEETVAEIEAAGHEYVDDLHEAELLFYNGSAPEFPDLPDNIKIVQASMAGIDALVNRGVVTAKARWANAGGLYADTVAESTVALLLAQLHRHNVTARRKTWARGEVQSTKQWLYDGKTIAIMGAGGIGVRLIELLKPFGVRIIAVNNSGRPVPGADETLPMSAADHVWSEADYFVLLMPLTETTTGIVNRDTLAKMKPNAVVVNVGRGPLVVTDDLVDAIRNGTIAGAALDVTDPEPLPDGHPLWDLEDVVITPHTANTYERIRTLTGALTVRNIELYEAG